MVDIKEIGISLSLSSGYRRLQWLEEALGWLQGLGFRLVEIGHAPFALIIDGEVRQQGLADFASVLNNFDLLYTIHGLNRLNLAYDARHELCKQIMSAQIKICRSVNASHLVYHSGLQALDDVHSGVRRSLLSQNELADGAKREIEALRQLAPEAADAGVVIGMENGDSHRWEHNVIAQFDLPQEALLQHHARLQIEPIIRQLEAIDHPNVGMTLDIAHLHIAAHDMGFDYLNAVRQAAPWVRHLHANDNFGRLDQGFDNESDRWAYGEADIHLPPGWGSIPYAHVFRCLEDYQGALILEIKDGFADYFGESLQTMRRILSAVAGEDSSFTS